MSNGKLVVTFAIRDVLNDDFCSFVVVATAASAAGAAVWWLK